MGSAPGGRGDHAAWQDPQRRVRVVLRLDPSVLRDAPWQLVVQRYLGPEELVRGVAGWFPGLGELYGRSERDVVAAFPLLTASQRHPYHAWLAPPTASDKRATLRLELTAHRAVFGYRLAWKPLGGVESRALTEHMTTLWGPPRPFAGGAAKAWFATADGARVVLRERAATGDLEIEVRRFQPLEQLVGPPGAPWGFELAGTPLLGASLDSVRQAYGERLEQGDLGLRLRRLPWPYNAFEKADVLLQAPAGRVLAFKLMLRYKLYPPARKELLGLLEAKYGAPQRSDHRYVFRLPGGVVVVEDKSPTLWVTAELAR